MNFFIKIGEKIGLIRSSRIANVLDGVDPTDAVNVRQLDSKIARGRYYADAANGVIHEIPHGLDTTPGVFLITLENGETANQNYTVTADATNITFTHLDAVTFVSTYIDWIAIV